MSPNLYNRVLLLLLDHIRPQKSHYLDHIENKHERALLSIAYMLPCHLARALSTNYLHVCHVGECVCNIFKSAHGADEAGALAERLKGNKSNADKQKIDSFDLGVRIKKVTRKAK